MNRKGFTFVEVLFVAGILIILTAALLTASVQMRTVFQATDISAELHEEARLAVNAMMLELRKTSRTQIAITQDHPESGTDRIIFNVPADSDEDGVPEISGGSIVWDSGPVTIRVEAQDGEKQLVIEHGADKKVLAENVKSINFIDQNIDPSLYMAELRIILELEKAGGGEDVYDFVFTSVVNMRN
jgi:type II secretory pathway pseudopilin PulG